MWAGKPHCSAVDEDTLQRAKATVVSELPSLAVQHPYIPMDPLSS